MTIIFATLSDALAYLLRQEPGMTIKPVTDWAGCWAVSLLTQPETGI